METEKMRIVLCQSSSGLKVVSGGFKSNLHLMKAIQTIGHSTRIISQFRREQLETEGVEFKTKKRVLLNGKYEVESYSFKYQDIQIVGCEVGVIGHPLEGDDNDDVERGNWVKGCSNPEKFVALQEYILQEAEEFQPTHFISNESTSLKISFELPVLRVFIVHAAEHLPFGPYKTAKGFGSYGSVAEADRLKQTDLIISVSEAIKNYVWRWGRLNSIVIHNHVALYGQPPFPDFTNNHTEGEYITAINVGDCKGFDIFRQIASEMPDNQFAAVCAWAMKDRHKDALRQLGNVVLLEPFSNMDELWRQTKVLLVPSIWFEAFGLVVIEAMLRGIPVICSDSGGLPEAKLGVEYVVKVNPMIEQECELRSYTLPNQDVSEWILVLKKLLTDRDHYLDVAKRSREAAHRYLEAFDQRLHEKELLRLQRNKLSKLKPPNRFMSSYEATLSIDR